MAALDRLRRWISRAVAPGGAVARRDYAGARNNRLTTGFANWGNSSADAELSMSLTALRTRSRQLMRDAPYAKRARTIVVNNVIGSGVGMQCQVLTSRGDLNERINADIESAWREWARAAECHTGGSLHFSDFERVCLSEVFTAGECFVRLHRRPFGDSKVPLALELIEAERVCDEFTHPQAGGPMTRIGVELDQFGRPVAYWIRTRHPGELRLEATQITQMERVPAADIIHLRRIERWPQTRGEPWLHNVLTKLNDMGGYVDSELTAARMSANYFATIQTPNDDALATTTDADTGTREMNIEPGIIEQLAPGDELKFHTPNRPNTALDPFLRYMLREVAAGIGVSYESISRDYSQSNYSSSRLALLDDRDLWRVLQQWWARSFRDPLYEEWLQAAVLSRAVSSIPIESYAIKPEAYREVSWKFRGWSWVDPTKEVEAYKQAVMAGFMSITQVVAQTGGGIDVEDVISERKRELAMFDDADIVLDTTVLEPTKVTGNPKPPTGDPNAAEAQTATDTQTPPARAEIRRLWADGREMRINT